MEEFLMKNLLRFFAVAALAISGVRAADDVVSAVHGVVTKTDAAAKTITVKTKDGTEQTFHWIGSTTVKGADATAAGSKDAFKGVTEGSEVVVHYTVKGTEKTGVEIDKLGKDGMKSIDGTIVKVGDGGKTVVVKSADGTEHTFKVAGHDTATAATDIGKGADKTGKVTVYYTVDGTKKVAHFFEKAF
jgi:hypothetical protein